MVIVEHANCSTVTSVSQEHAFFSTLQLLEFNVFAAEKQYKISFKPDMFRVPNKKGLEVVLHFLLTKLDPARSKTEFVGCWPAYDVKRCHLLRKNVFNWLTELNRDYVEGVQIPRINSSTLTKASGSLVIKLLERLSSLVLVASILQPHHRQQARIGPDFCPAKLHLNLAAAATLRLELHAVKRKVAERAAQTQFLRTEWNGNARAISDGIQGLSRDKKRLETKKDSLETTQKDCITAFSSDKKFIKTLSLADEESLRADVQHKASQLKQYLRRFNEVGKKRVAERAVVSSLINGCYGENVIHHDKIALQVPSIVIQEYQKKLTEGTVGNTYRGGHLCLVALTKISLLGLKLLANSLHDDVPKPFPPAGALQSRRLELAGNVETLQDLRTWLDQLNQECSRLGAEMWLAPQPSYCQDVRLQSPLPVFSLTPGLTHSSKFLHVNPLTPEPRKRRSIALTPLSMRKYKRGANRVSNLSANVEENSRENLENMENPSQNLSLLFEKSQKSLEGEETFSRREVGPFKELNDLSLLDVSTNNISF